MSLQTIETETTNLSPIVLERMWGVPFAITSASGDNRPVCRLIDHLEAAAAVDMPVENLVFALRGLLAVGIAGSCQFASADELVRLEFAFPPAAHVASGAVAGRIPAAAIHLGCAAAVRITRQFRLGAEARETVPVFAAMLDHVALLADELDVFTRRRRIERDGDQFRRSITIANAVTADLSDGLAN